MRKFIASIVLVICVLVVIGAWTMAMPSSDEGSGVSLSESREASGGPIGNTPVNQTMNQPVYDFGDFIDRSKSNMEPGEHDDMYVNVLILDPNNDLEFVHCQKDVPLDEIEDLGNGRWSFPNAEGRKIVFSMPPIKSRPYKKGDPEAYVEIWEIRPDGKYISEPVVSERQVFFDPSGRGVFVCWMGSCLDTDGVSEKDLFDYFENYYINPVPVKTETRVVRATPIN